MWALIIDGKVFELTDIDPVGRFHPDLIWVSVENFPEIKEGWVATNTNGAWTFEPYVPPPPTPEEILASQSLKLQGFIQLASAQKVALTNRIATLQDAVEMEMATQDEIAELPIRQAQLVEWKRYAIYLGRVTGQAGWPPDAQWPVQPVNGMDLTVSASATDQS